MMILSVLFIRKIKALNREVDCPNSKNHYLEMQDSSPGCTQPCPECHHTRLKASDPNEAVGVLSLECAYQMKTHPRWHIQFNQHHL